METETQRLLHELKVHQIELGAQNAELLRLKEDAEHEAKKYLELYDSAPSGYFTLSEEGEILELNLAGAQMLGKERSRLSNVRFGIFVSPETRSIFNLFIEKVFASQSKETCEVILSKDGTLPVDVNLTGIVKAGGANCFVTAVDISERKRTSQLSNANIELLNQNDEKAKHATELFISNELIAFQRDRLQNIARLVPGVVYQYRLSPDGSSCFPYSSDAIQSVCRVTPEEVREDGAKVFANLHPDDYNGVVASILQSAKDLSTWQQDFRVKFDDGTIRYLYGNAVPQLEADGSVLWHGFINDITERKEIERVLQQSEQRYHSLIECTPNAVVIHREMKIIYANPAAITMFGATSLQELEGTSIWDRIHPDCHSIVKEQKQINSDAPLIELKYLKLDGTVFDAEMQGTSIIYDGKPSIHTALYNITDRKKAEEELRQSHARFASMIANISDVIGIMGADGLMKYESTNIEKFFGWLPEERIGTSAFANVHPEDIPLVHNAFDSLIEEDYSVKTLQFRHRCKDGSYKPIELTASNQVNNPIINGVLLNFRDIIKRKENEQKIILQNEKLRKLNSEKDKFFSIIAHDLRGPMGLFMQLTELLADKETVLSADEVSEMIDDMSNLAQNTFKLLENLLEWSQISREYYDFNPERIILNKVVAECFKILTDQARRKGIELVDNISNETEVIADKNMLKSVIRNLFSNAIKYTSEGGKVTISAQTAENNQISVSVKDTGIGMTEDLRNELFRINANTKRPGTNGEKSTGLGLLLCKEFVEKQGGKISVESEQKIGSVFSFTLPLTGLLPKKAVPEIVVPPDSQKRPLKNLNILIAEDDEITLKLISYFIKGISNQVFKAKTGEEAVEICRNHPEIDLVIMDIKMPGMDGYEATRQIRQFNPRIVILADSTFTLPSDLELAIEAGCNDYLLKPFSREVFEGMIQKFV